MKKRRVRISLPKYDNGGEKGRVITYKDDAKLIDGTANFDVISGVPISQEYNKQIKDRLYSGKWGFNTATGALVKLKGNQQKTPPKAVRDLRAREENERAYVQSIREAGVRDSRLMGGSQTGRVYENWWEDPNYQPTQQEIDEFIRMGHDKANTAFVDVASSLPGIETVADAAGLIKATVEGDKTGMGIYSAGLALPFIPARIVDKGRKAITTLGGLVPAKKTVPEASEFIVRSKDKVKADIHSQMKKIRDLEKSPTTDIEPPYLLSKDEVIERKGKEVYDYFENKRGTEEFRRISRPREEDVGIISDYKNIEQLRFAKDRSWEEVKSRTDLFKNKQQFESAKTEANKVFNKYKNEFISRFGKGRDEEVLIYGAYKDLKSQPYNRGQFYTSDKFAETHGLSNMDLTPQEKFLTDTYQLEFSNLFNNNVGDMDNPRFAQYLSSKFEPIILKNKFQKPSQLVRGSRFDREVRTRPAGSEEGFSVWKHYDDLEVGDIIYPEHNWSTTSKLTGDVWGEKKAYINVPKGQSAFRPNMYKGSVFPEEEEVVLPSMLGYKVEGINLDAGRNEPRFIFDIHDSYKYGGLFRLPEFPDGGKYNWGPNSKAERKKLYNYNADQEAPDMILTLKDDKSFIDNISNWATVSGTEIHPAFNDQIKKRLYSGKWGYNPKTGYLVNLEKAKAKDRIATLPEAEKKYQKTRQDVPYEQAVKDWNKDRVRVQIPDSDAWSPDFEFEGLGRTMNANEMRGQTVYMTQQEADDYLQAQLQSSIDATYRNPIMYAPGMIYTAGAAPALDLLIGTGSSLEPLSRGDYKEAALTFGLGALPFTISKAGTIAKQVDKAIYPKRTWRASSTVGENIDYAADLRTQKLAEKIAKQGEFTTSDLGELEFYLRGNTGRKGLLMGDDMALTEYKVPFWKRNVSENPDVVSLKELQGSPVNKSEYIIPSGGLSKFLYPRKTTLLKGAPEHLTKVGDWDLKGTIPFSYESPMYYTNFAKYLEDQMNAAITPNVSFAKEIPSKVRQVENVSKFRSEIDWRNWVRDKADFDNNPDVIQNLYDIEKRTKADGTWMKNADGTAFEGTPEEFVILQSDRFKQAYPKGYDTWYSGRIIDPNKQFPKIVEAYPEGRSIFGGDRGIATHYSSNKGNIITAADENQTGVFKFISPKSSNSLDIDARGFGWKSIPVDPKLDIIPLWEGKPISDWQRRLKTSYTDELGNIQSGYKIKTDDIASHIENKGIDYANIRNVFDGIDADYVRIHNMKPGNYPKSLSGNILFDLTNPNIYKSLIPAAIATGLLTYSDKFEDGGHSKYGNFFQYPHGGSHDTDNSLPNYASQAFISDTQKRRQREEDIKKFNLFLRHNNFQ